MNQYMACVELSRLCCVCVCVSVKVSDSILRGTDVLRQLYQNISFNATVTTENTPTLAVN